MKKNFGFTLAEALLTLSIIGVVAGLVAPPLIMNTGKAKIGPTLYKAKNNFENAVSMMLVDRGVDSISAVGQAVLLNEKDENGKDLYDMSKVEDLVTLLGDYIKINCIKYADEPDSYYQVYDRAGNKLFNASNNKTYIRFDSEDRITYWIDIWTPREPSSRYENIPTNQECGQVFVDINGEKGPNKETKDVFRFMLYNDGTLRPHGSQGYERSKMMEERNQLYYWWENHNCDEQGINQSYTCTGSIFENDLKIIYE